VVGMLLPRDAASPLRRLAQAGRDEAHAGIIHGSRIDSVLYDWLIECMGR
jgi:hypothetical protein